MCGTCFSRGDKLKVHSRIHSNVRPYGCGEEGCHYRAIDSGSLRKHMRTHTNERPYRCVLMCGCCVRVNVLECEGERKGVYVRVMFGVDEWGREDYEDG